MNRTMALELLKNWREADAHAQCPPACTHSRELWDQVIVEVETAMEKAGRYERLGD